MLSHSRVQSRNSWVSIKTLDFARVRTSDVIGVGCRTPLPPADDHTAGGGMSGGRVREERDRSSAMADWPRNRTPPRWTPLDNWSSSQAPGGWARLTAGSGRIFGTVAHVLKRGLGR